MYDVSIHMQIEHTCMNESTSTQVQQPLGSTNVAVWTNSSIYDAIKQEKKMSLKSVKFNPHFSDWFFTSFAKLPFTTDPIEIGQLVPKIWAALKRVANI